MQRHLCVAFDRSTAGKCTAAHMLAVEKPSAKQFAIREVSEDVGTTLFRENTPAKKDPRTLLY